jgi:mannose-6-phosphate isomerase-like protein (cupin superfamily)
MSYGGESGDVSAVGVPWADMHTVRMSSGTVGSFIATGSLTQGRYGLYRWDMPPNVGGASPHFHRTFSEAFYVLSGSPTFWNGSDWIRGEPGFYLHVPEGGIHGFLNSSEEPASFLILFAPGAMREGYFLALAESAASGHQMSKAEFEALCARFDQVNVA